MADCFNCKHRHHMVCIPESNDCEKVYLLDDHDVFEINKDRCDFYKQNDIVYDFSALYGAIRFTREIYDHSTDEESSTIKTFKFDPCIITINGILYDFSSDDNDFVKITFYDNRQTKMVNGMNIVNIIIEKRQMNTYIHTYSCTLVSKTIVIRYNRETNTIIINGIGYLEEDQ